MPSSLLVLNGLQCGQLKNRPFFLLGTHLPSETRTLAAKVDDFLRKAYARCFGANLLYADGTWERQEDPAFYRDLIGLKASAGRVGYRSLTCRAAFINVLTNVLLQMMGNWTRQPLWSSLENIFEIDSFKKTSFDRDSENQVAPRPGHHSGRTRGPTK